MGRCGRGERDGRVRAAVSAGKPSSPGESHWHGVLSLLELSPEQRSEAVSMGELFAQLMGKVSRRAPRESPGSAGVPFPLWTTAVPTPRSARPHVCLPRRPHLSLSTFRLKFQIHEERRLLKEELNARANGGHPRSSVRRSDSGGADTATGPTGGGGGGAAGSSGPRGCPMAAAAAAATAAGAPAATLPSVPSWPPSGSMGRASTGTGGSSATASSR